MRPLCASCWLTTRFHGVTKLVSGHGLLMNEKRKRNLRSSNRERERERERERKWGESGERGRGRVWWMTRCVGQGSSSWSRRAVSKGKDVYLLGARVYQRSWKESSLRRWCSATSDGERVFFFFFFTIQSGAFRLWNIHVDAKMKKEKKKRSIDTRRRKINEAERRP